MARFVEVRDGNNWLVIDLKGEPHVLCCCSGFKAPLQAEYICQALEAYHQNLYDTFDMGAKACGEGG